MITRDYLVLSPDGIHARPATALIRLVRQFKSVISLKKENQLVRLNSMLNVLSFGAKGGDTLTVVFDGEDEEDAALALDHFFREQLKNL